MQSLDGAHQRVSRAGKHLIELEACIRNFCEAKKHVVATQHEPALRHLRQASKKWGHVFRWTVHDGDVLDPMISILTGEVVYNLRAALDYLIYELAYLDSKQIAKGTQFPIEDSGKAFVERIGSINAKGGRRVQLRGLSDYHVALISWYQPCYGCYWTRCLRIISDPDKHRRLTVVGSSVKVLINETKPVTPESPVDVNCTSIVRVVFGDGSPVIETLEQLHSQVSQTIDAFDSEFK